MKKLLAILCAVMLLATCSLTAFAAGEGKITINNTVVGQTYSVYKIADLSYNADAKAYTYTAVNAWVGFFTAQSAYFDIAPDTNIVTAKGDINATQAASIAADAIAYAQTNSISATASTPATGTSVVFDELELGYYLVDSTVGTICILDTTDTTFEKDEKNGTPSVTKQVKEGDTYGATNDDSFFKTVSFKSTVNVVIGAENYVLNDTMDNGLDFNNDIVITLDGETVTAAGNYTVAASAHGFSITFENSYVSSIPGKTLVIEYTATINENANVGSTGNVNKTQLQYGNNSDLYSNEASTTTYVYSFDLVKTDEADKVLDGAKFKLYDAASGGNEIKVVKTANGQYRVAKAEETGVEIETLNGKATITGLDSATYYLEETLAPAGYNKLTARKDVTISKANNNATVTEGVYSQGGVQVINKTGAVLPETGSFGTTMFIIVGGGLALFAAILLVSKKRMANIG